MHEVSRRAIITPSINQAPQGLEDHFPLISILFVFVIGLSESRGLQGPQEVQGPPGPDKELQVRMVSGDARVVSPGGTGSSTASCEPDEVATGGGFLWDGLGNIENSRIEDTLAAPNEWVATDDNPASNTAADVIEAHAVCAKLVDVP